MTCNEAEILNVVAHLISEPFRVMVLSVSRIADMDEPRQVLALTEAKRKISRQDRLNPD
jgi:hypothetical protein